jgi:hypothetical protein
MSGAAMDDRRAIVFDGKHWYVRHVASTTYDLVNDVVIYRCDVPISNDHKTLADVPEVKALISQAVKEETSRWIAGTLGGRE